jgi:hypothetical protein
MPHVRQSIRDDIIDTVTGLSATGTRVYKSRVYPMDASKLPGLCVYSKDESSTVLTMGPNRTISRTLTIVIESYVKALTGYDDDLDTIALQVENALMADRTRDGLAKDTQITSFQADFSGQGEQPFATGIITVDVVYHTKEASAGVAV